MTAEERRWEVNSRRNKIAYLCAEARGVLRLTHLMDNDELLEAFTLAGQYLDTCKEMVGQVKELQGEPDGHRS